MSMVRSMYIARAVVILAVAVLMLPFFADAARLTGAQYLQQVNSQLQAAGRPAIVGGTASALMSNVDRLSDNAYAALERANAGRPIWITSPSQIGQIAYASGLDENGVVDPTKATIAASKPPSGECTSWLFDFSFDACIWKPFAKALGSGFLSLGAFFLQLSGSVFDALIQRVIIAFGQTLSNLNVTDAINTGWTVFRDFSNILIIGFFVFIAISIILGAGEFGQKRLIANVLVVAVLMNFSLLFTKLIIDGSNFVAFRIYAQMAGASGAGAATQFNTAEAFMKPMKIAGIFDTYKLVDDVARQTDSGMQALAFGFVGFLLLTLLTAVLLYGSYLILWRGIMFIFLMLTAPFAFATFLVPSLAKGEYGWNSWWKMLINSAAFGPLLMILLALSLAIISAAGSRTRTTLGEVITNPVSLQGEAWSTILVYAIGTGLLFVSFKFASSFAGSLGGGYAFGTGLAKLAGKIPLAAGVGIGAYLGGSMLRNTLGASAANKSRAAEKEISRLNSIASNKKLDEFQRNQARSQMQALMKQKASLDARASKDFNFLKTGLGSAIAKPLGLDEGKDKGGFVGRSKEVTNEAVKAAADATISKADAKATAKETVEKEMKSVREAVESQKKASEALVESARSLAEAEKEQAGHTKSIDDHMKENRDAMQQKVVIEQQFKEGKMSSAEKDTRLREQEDRINKANQKIQEIKDIEKKHMETPQVKEANRQLAEASARLRDLDKQQAAAIEDLANDIVSTSAENAGNAMADIKHADSYTRESIVKGLRKKNQNKRLVDQFKAVQEEAGDDAKPDAPANPPPTT